MRIYQAIGRPPSADDQLCPESEADAAAAHPFHRGVDRAAAFEADDHAFADPRLERADDHRPAGRDVDHGHEMHAAAEEERAAIDQILVALLGALIGDALLRTPDHLAAKPARRHCPHDSPLSRYRISTRK